ncbi:MAG: 4-hydroxyphenylacetate decarboxylase large subunit [Elusimicrobiaceae bacterium]
MPNETAKMTPRAEKLMDLYLSAKSSADIEFPYWYTRRYMELDNEIPVVRRALALKEAFSRLTPVIFPGELIAMQKTAYYRGSFPMPWLSESYFMAKEDELYKEALKSGASSADEYSKFGSGGGNVTQSSGKTVSIAGKFGMRQEEVPALLKLAKLWQGKSVQDVALRYEKLVPDYETKENIMRAIVCMFDSGYTLPQGREVINYYYPLQHGFDGIIKIAREMADKTAGRADGDGLTGMNRLYNYEAVIRAIEGVQNWILNYAGQARRLEKLSTDKKQKLEYRQLARRLENIAHKPPASFLEAVQLCWTIHIAALNEDAISGLSPGRLGQVLYPFYRHDIDSGALTPRQALEILECQRIKFTCIDCFASAGVVGGVLSGNTFNNLSLGGLAADGGPACNELEELLIEAGMTCKSTQPTLSLLYDDKLPEPFVLKAAECVKTGTGYPAFVNNRTAMSFLLDQYRGEGMTVREASAWAIGGCLETSPGSWLELEYKGRKWSIPGGSGQPTSVGVHFISLPKILELVLNNGFDARARLQVFKPHGCKLGTYEELWRAFRNNMSKAVEVLALCNNIEHDVWRKNNTAVFNALLKPDCLAKGHLINELGYRYNATYNIESTGTVNLVNSLSALKKLVYDDKKYSLAEMKQALAENFGYLPAQEVNSYSLAEQKKKAGADKYAEIHSNCLRAPKYGNADEYADSVLKEWETWFTGECRGYESLYGFKMYACQISVSTHGAMGAATGATPDGRLAGTTFADGSMSAYPGTDKNGPFALFESAACWDHAQSQNSQMNIKLHPSAVAGKCGAKKLAELTRAYMRKGGFHVQYNIVDSQTLRDAQLHPENYRELLVRVAGFTQYWVEISKPIQDEIIARTEYKDA